MILTGDCVELMATLDAESVDAIVTDPPYGLEFMGKEWDRLGDVGQISHSGPTERDESTVFGRQRVALNGSANRRCRTCGHWAYSGTPCRCETPDFPSVRNAQSLLMQSWHTQWATEAFRVAKPGAHLLAFGGTRTYHRLASAIEDAGWEIRDCLVWAYASGFPKSLDVSKAIDKAAGAEREVVGAGRWNGVKGELGRDGGITPDGYVSHGGTKHDATAPATPDAQRWQGWGTALKPAWEPIVMARKPLTGTVAANVLAHGTGALNIDATRIGTAPRTTHKDGNHRTGTDGPTYHEGLPLGDYPAASARWPANLILTDPIFDGGIASWMRMAAVPYGHTGTYSRFFLIPKAARSDREPVLRPEDHPADKRFSTHPTVKPVELMRHLVRLVTPPGGTVLDCFLGSGTTAIACEMEGFAWIGMEKEPEYVAIAEARLNGTQRGIGL